MAGELADLIRQRIREEGPLTFADFMGMALYYPGLGYYSSGLRRTGAAGDYFTSPQAHPVFGALIARQLEQMWRVMGQPSPFTVVEAGAGEGRLARDILGNSLHLDAGFREALFYVAVDVQVRSLRLDTPYLSVGYHHAGSRPTSTPLPLRAVASRGLPFRGLRGCIMSNELLDAFPFHRLLVQGGVFREVYVTLERDVFREAVGEPSPKARRCLAELEGMPPEGALLEVSPAQWQWIEEAGRALDAGFVLTIDYGCVGPPGASTLASYRRHGAGHSPYEAIGEQDLSSHVDFGALMAAGGRVGLAPLGLVSQKEFLSNLGIHSFMEAAARLGLPQKEHYANQLAMRELIETHGLGGFGVLIQAKGVEAPPLDGLTPDNEAKKRLHPGKGSCPVPLLTPEHMPLLEGRYPHLAWDLGL